MKKNIFKFLMLFLSLIFTVGCEMTLSFNDYNEARNKTATTTTKTTNSSGDTTSNGGNSTTNPSISNITRGPESSTTTKSSSTNMTVNRFTVVLHMPSGETNEITVQRWNNESMPEEFRQGVTVVFNGDQYTIVGYYTDPDFNNPIDLETAKIENDIDLYAKFEKIEPLPDKVTITYVSNGGVETEALVVDRGTKIASRNLPSITKLATDTKKFIFGGWYYDVNFILKVNVDDEINQDTKIYAKWREVVREGLYEYTESEDLTEWYITAFIGKDEDVPENLVFPTMFNSKPVTKISYIRISNKYNIRTIEVPEGITEFNARLTKLSQFRVLTLASTLTKIDIEDNLTDCYRLVEVYNKSNIDLLGENTSYNYVHVIHTSMSEPSIIRQVGNLELAISSKGTYIIGTSEPVPANGELVMPSYIMVDGEQVYGYHIGAFLYFQNSDIKKVTISKSIASVGQFAFSENENLEVVEINTSNADVRKGAFYRSQKINTVYLGTANINFEQMAFPDYSIEKVYAPDLFSWMTYKFESSSSTPLGLSSQARLYFQDSTGDETYTFGGYAYNYKKCTELIIPNGTTEIGDYAFYNLRGLTEASIPNSIERIGKYAFGLNGLIYNNDQLVKATRISGYNYTYEIKNGIVEGNCMYIGNASNPYLVFQGTPYYYYESSNERIFNLHEGCKFADANSAPNFGGIDETNLYLQISCPSTFVQFMAGSLRFNQGHIFIKIGTVANGSQMTYLDLSEEVLERAMSGNWYDAQVSVVIPKSVRSLLLQNWGNTRVSSIYYMGTYDEWDLVEKKCVETEYIERVVYSYSTVAVTDEASGHYYWCWENESTGRIKYWPS